MTIIDGKKLASDILAEVTKESQQLIQANVHPKLAVVFVGNDKPSRTYIKRKKEAADEAHITFELHRFPDTITEEKLIDEIKKIQSDTYLHGLIVQLPLPAHFDQARVLNTIDPTKDVDCMTDINIGKLVMETNIITPPTPAAVLAILESINADIKGKNITIVGAGALVGKPLTIMLLNKQATVTVCNIFTTDLAAKCQKADILITAVGKKDLIKKNMVKKGAIVIDTGIAFDNKKMYGDVDVENVAKKTSYITPTPGGVGPITVALLLKNVVLCAQNR